MSEFEPSREMQDSQYSLDHTGHCLIAASAEPNTSGLFNPRAFTPIELRRIARQQVLEQREVHVLFQRDGGVEDVTFDFRSADLSGRKPETCAREIGEIIELADGFFFVSPNQ